VQTIQQGRRLGFVDLGEPELGQDEWTLRYMIAGLGQVFTQPPGTAPDLLFGSPLLQPPELCDTRELLAGPDHQRARRDAELLGDPRDDLCHREGVRRRVRTGEQQYHRSGEARCFPRLT
jgi:hypothetical protein